MPQLVSVRFRYNPKPLWFDPKGKTYTAGTEVLVETERGREVGFIVDPAIEATDKQVAKLKTPLKPVIRELTELDYEHMQALEEKGKNAMPYFREKVEEYELDIKPVEVQYLFSGERAVFFFSSEDRVDFRELVRDLAQHFHVRIDMRQIGARDEAKELGGIAHCGEEFCCTRFGGEFQPVSIRMAKEQDLPLNPTKISGVCGRLMCCLRYEYEAYKDFKKRAPKKGTPVDTPIGDAVISGYNTPSEIMELRLEDGKKLNVPLAEMECQRGEGGACTRCSITSDTVERCASRSMLIALGALENSLGDVLAGQSDHLDADINVDIGGSGQTTRKRRRRSSEGAAGAGSADKNAGGGGKGHSRNAASSATKQRSSEEGASTSTRKRRRRSGGSAGSTNDGAGSGSATGADAGANTGASGASGQKKQQGGHSGSERNDSQKGQRGGQQNSQQKKQKNQQRKQRRPQKSQDGTSQAKATQKSQDEAGSSRSAHDGSSGGTSNNAEARTEKPRPGQRSSGLRTPRTPQDSSGTTPQETSGDGRRKRRRRNDSEGSAKQ